MQTCKQRCHRMVAIAAACGGLMVASVQKHYPYNYTETSVSKISTELVNPTSIVEPTVDPFYVAIRPLGDLISQGEGDWNAVNRGRAGDTPGGFQRLFGSTCEKLTVGELMDMQSRGEIYAIGRYQFIPTTLRYAVSVSGVSRMDFFSPKIQDKLFSALIEHKRPVVGLYLRGESDKLGTALDELAKEWASIEYRYGSTYYSGISGNSAHITRVEVKEVLEEIRTNLSK